MAENTATPIPRQVAESQNRPAVVEDQKEEMEQKIKKPRKRKPAQTPGQPADKALEKMAESEPNQPNTPDHQITQQQLDEQLLKLSPEQLETQIANGTDEEKAALRERYEQLKLKQKTVTSEQVVTESLTGDEDLSESEKLLLALGKDNKAQAIGSIALSWFPPARIAYEALTSGYVNYRQAAKDGASRFQLAKMAAGYGTRIGAAVMTGGLSEAALYGTKALISFSKGDINVKNALFGAGSLAIGLTTGNIVAGNIANESVRTMATAATRFATTEALFQGAQLVVENPKEREKLRKGAAFASGIVAGVSVAQGADYLIPGDSPVEDVLQTDIGELTGDAADGLLDNFRGFFSFLNTNESNEMNDNQANTRNIKELPDLTVREEIVQGANETAENLLNRLTGKSEEDILREKIEERVGGLTGETNQTDDPIGLIQRLFGIEPPAPDGKTEDNTETIRGIFETDDSKPIIKPETSASEESFFEKFGWRPSEQEIGEIENERPELNRTPEPKESQNNKINPDIIASNAEAQPVVPPAPIPEMDPYEISRLEEVFRIPERSDSLIPNPDIPNGFNINFDGIADQDVIRMIHYDVTNLLNTQIGEQFANSYDPANPDSVQTREFTFNAHLLNGDEVSVPISISNEEFNAYRAADPVNPLSFSDYVLGKTNLALTSQGILRDQSGIPITTGMQAFYDAWDYSEPERDLLRMNIMNQAANETGLVQQYINPTYIENYGANIDSPDITLVETLAAHYTQDPDPLLDGRVIAQEITAQPSQIEVTNALNSVLQITEGDSFPAFTPEAFQELQTTSNGWALKSLDYVYNSGVDRNFSVTLHDGKTLVFDTTNTSDNPADAIIANTEFSPAGVEPNDIRNELSALYPTASPQEIEQLFVETTMKLTEQIETVEVQKQIIQQAVSSPSLANNGTEQIVIASTDIGAPANIIIVPELIPGTTTTQFTVFSANDPTTSQTIYSDIDTLVENMPSDFGITANRMEDLTNSFVQGVQARPGSTFSPQPVNGAGIISTTPIDATVPIAQAVAQNLATTNRTLRMPAGQAPPGGSGLAFPSFAIPPGSISPGVGNNFLNNVEQTVQNIAQQAGPFVSNYGGQAVDAFGNVLGEGIELGQNIRQGVETQGLLPPVFRAAGDFFDEALDTVFGPWWANTKGFFRNIRDSVRNAF